MEHPKDRRSDNPRIQCVVCGKWMRLYKRRSDGGWEQVFWGGCSHRGPNGGTHLAEVNGDDDVCQPCCDTRCKAIAEAATVKESLTVPPAVSQADGAADAGEGSREE